MFGTGEYRCARLRGKARVLLSLAVLLTVGCATATVTLTAKDPGVRRGTADAGGPLPGLASAELEVFKVARATFQEVENVANGLGPRFNLDSCAGCHAQPAVGGSSPSINPQIAVA